MQRYWRKTETADAVEWVLKKNCSLSPKQSGALFAAAAGLSLSVALGWALAGVWVVLPFAVIEVLALAAAFLMYSRHAADFERVELRAGRLLVERADGLIVEVTELVARSAKVDLAERSPKATGFSRSNPTLLKLSALGRTVEIGRFVPQSQRETLMLDMRRSLSAIARIH
jgi:uncharacterized membrane protein